MRGLSHTNIKILQANKALRFQPIKLIHQAVLSINLKPSQAGQLSLIGLIVGIHGRRVRAQE
jgi:hypothetical protein